MIVRPRPAGLGLIFAMRGSILPVVAPRLVVILLISGLAVWLHHVWPGYFGVDSAAPFTLLGLGLPIFLSFRNSACYDRWWEGRKQWGALLAESRNILRNIHALLPADDPLRRPAAHRVGAFAHALRAHLRGSQDPPPRDWLPAGGWVRRTHNRPGTLLTELAEIFAGRLREGQITDITYRLFSDHLSVMSDIQAACERLRATPMPFAYSLMLHRTVWLFCLLLPFGLVDTLGLGTPVITVVLAYAFLGLDALGEELEEPFSTAPNGLPLDSLVRAIEIAVAETLEEPLPEPLRPENFILP
ncbi:bestrophin family protein [Acidocella sp.]|uniref:bestrophin family protein n=1 Tax=Acidocella sp. TaxID=50710 RepID=UPI003CFF08F4